MKHKIKCTSCGWEGTFNSDLIRVCPVCRGIGPFIEVREFDNDKNEQPPDDWLCSSCHHPAGDWARPIDDENIKVNKCDERLRGRWECGHCGNTEWHAPVKHGLRKKRKEQEQEDNQCQQ